MHPLSKTVLKNIQDQKLFPPGSTIVVGVSGGTDSMALLHLLLDLQPFLGLTIIVGHINHRLRSSAGANARFVKKISHQLGKPFFLKKILIRCHPHKSSVEEIARELRLQALGQIAKAQHAYGVALAHHRDDLAETVLMRIVRGSGLEGLAGMQPKSLLWGTKYIRPLLGISRRKIEKYLNDQKIKYRNDPTNKSRAFFRNRIRHDLLPYLEQHYQPGIRDALTRLGTTAAADYEYLTTLAQKNFLKCLHDNRGGTLRLKIQPLLRLPLALRRLVLRHALKEIKGDKRQFTLAHMNEIEKWLATDPSPRAALALPAGIRFRKKRNSLLVCIARKP